MISKTKYTDIRSLNLNIVQCKTPLLIIEDKGVDTDNLFIENIKYWLEKYQNFGGIYTNFIKIYNGIEIQQYLKSYERKSLVEGWSPPLTAIYNVSLIKSVGLFREDVPTLFHWDMWLKISEKAPIFHCPKFSYFHTVETLISTNDTQEVEKILKSANR